MSTSLAQQQFLPYENFTLGIRLKYPADWSKQDQFPGPMVMFSSQPEGPMDLFRENLVVVIGDVPAGITLSEYVDQSIAQGRMSMPNFNVISQSPVSLSNLPALEAICSWNPGPFSIRSKIVSALANGKSYSLTYNAEAGKYDKFLSAAQAIIDSFEIA